jgi:hypothetical protein
VLGLVAVGCGSGTSSAVPTDAAEEQPPANSDQAPNNAGDTATNTDVAPSNPDAAPSSSEDPAGSGGGGRLGALCEKVCSTLKTIDDCSGGMTMVGMQDACSAEVNCQIPADLPCQNEIADAFDCIFDNLALICSAGNDNQDPKPDANPCKDVARKLTDCAEASGLNTDGNGNGNGNGNQGSCSEAGGCECASDCLSCLCDAGTDTDAQTACTTGVCATP